MDVLANKDELGANNQLSIKDAPGLQNGDDAVEALTPAKRVPCMKFLVVMPPFLLWLHINQVTQDI